MSNEDKLDLLAELIEPAGEILSDQAALAAWRDGDRRGGLQRLIRGHKGAIIEILARLEGRDPAEYELDGGALLLKLLARWNGLKELAEALFPLPAQSADAGRSGPATEATGGKGR